MITKTGQFRRMRFSVSPERGTAAYLIRASYYGRVIAVRTTDSQLYRLVNSSDPKISELVRWKIYQLIRQGWLGSPTKRIYEARQAEQAGTRTDGMLPPKKANEKSQRKKPEREIPQQNPGIKKNEKRETMRPNEEKKIVASSELREEIEHVFRCTRMTVWRALNYKNGSPRSQRIRKYAIQKGGQLQRITTTSATRDDIL